MKQEIRSLQLPEPIAAYFSADKVDGETVSQCFTENAVVKDEGHTHRGRAAIKEWKSEVMTKYQYTCQPLAFEDKDGTKIVTCHLTGDFPGSPVDLRFLFKLENDKIASLEVIP